MQTSNSKVNGHANENVHANTTTRVEQSAVAVFDMPKETVPDVECLMPMPVPAPPCCVDLVSMPNAKYQMPHANANVKTKCKSNPEFQRRMPLA